MADTMTGSLQENLITILAYDDRNGRIIANLVEPNYYDGDYRLIAERCLDYWRRESEAPKAHLADLLDDILEDPENHRARVIRRILINMQMLSESINTHYVVSSAKRFIRGKKMQAAIYKAAQQYDRLRELAIEDIENIFDELLRAREIDFDAGVTLGAVDQFVDYMTNQQSEFVTGIPQLDQRYCTPMRGTSFVLLAPTGYGKSWWLVHMGRQALAQRKKVLHISLEMSEMEVLLRYYQNLFSLHKRGAEKRRKSLISVLEVDDKGSFLSWSTDEVESDFNLDSPFVEMELESHIEPLGKKIENLRIKRFPTRGLNSQGLRAYLDTLEAMYNFIPDIILYDQLPLTKTNDRDYRISLGREYENYRGLAVERNYAFVTVHQVSKKAVEAPITRTTMVAEDWSIIHTSDYVVTYSQTPSEKELKLARLHVAKVRGEADDYKLLITQNYDMGQFYLESAYLNDKYFEQRKQVELDKYDEDQYDDGDDEE